MTSCATVPTTISDIAVAMRSQIASSVAISASANHKAANEKISVIADLYFPRKHYCLPKVCDQANRERAGNCVHKNAYIPTANPVKHVGIISQTRRFVTGRM